MEIVYQPRETKRLGEILNENLDGTWTHFRAAVAFIKKSGTKHIVPALKNFARDRHVEIIAGIDHHGTSSEGLQDLLGAVSPKGKVIVFHNPIRHKHTFHPKIYLFKSATQADVTIGSGNLTQGGLFENYEAALRIRLDLDNHDHATILQSIEDVLDKWASLSPGTTQVLDNQLLTRLTAMGVTPPEQISVPEPGDTEWSGGESMFDTPFVPHSEFQAPKVSGRQEIPVELTPETSQTISGYVMTLLKTDVGVGQTTAGTSRRSPEIFIPLAARDSQPEFWDWPDKFLEDPKKRGKRDRTDVHMRLAGEGS